MRSLPAILTAFFLLLMVFMFTSLDAEAETIEGIFEADLEGSDGGFTHGGDLDAWEWGEPGPGALENPGPDGTPDGEKCFGAPLNGTYSRGTRSYLELTEVSVGSYHHLKLEYIIWFDLELLEDEKNDSGSMEGNDHMLVQILDMDGNWFTVMNHSGSSSSQWVDMEVDISSFSGNDLGIRFLLVDEVDGGEDNGVFIDNIRITGELRPLEDISFSKDPLVFTKVVVDEISKVHFWIENNGRNIPSDSYVSLSISGPGGFSSIYLERDIEMEREYFSDIEWEPTEKGAYELFINLTVEGNIRSTNRKAVICFDPVFHDDLETSGNDWSVTSIKGDSTWSIDSGDQFSSSGNNVALFGLTDDIGNGQYFRGDSYSTLTGPTIDLSFMDEAYLYITHSYGFQGDTGSCGGLVQIRPLGEDWVTLDPDQPHSRRLKDDISGPMEGEYAFQGARDWYQIGFNLLDHVGSEIALRFVVSSGEGGEGEGWSVDDIMIIGKGLDPNDREPPLPVEGLAVFVVGDGEVEVGWTSSFASDLDHYNLYIGTGEQPNIESLDPFMVIGSENDTYVFIDGLDLDVEYWIAVTAIDRMGNEDGSIFPSFFQPIKQSSNRPPVASIRVIGGTNGKIGDVFILNGTSSTDPDGDELTYTWRLPDGSVRQGSQVRWKSEIAGKSLEVNLVVQDTVGNRDSTNITLDIEDDSSNPTESEDLYGFLLCMSPFVVFIILAVILVSWLKGSKGRKLKKELLIEGIETGPVSQKVNAEVIEEPQSRSKKVMDLTPVLTTKSHDRPPVRREKPDPRPRTAEPMPKPIQEREKRKELHLGKVETVTALVECPFCQNAFKARVEKVKLMSGEPFEVKCTHCGRTGEIG